MPGSGRGIRSFLLVTLDSCRFDSAASAGEFLGIGEQLLKASAHGTFTLPSHIALFLGYPPVLADTGERCEFALFGNLKPTRGHMLWKGDPAYSYGMNWLDDVREHGMKTVGAGGVRWFLHDQLRAGFDEFHFWGPTFAAEDLELPAPRPEHFALHHTNVLVSAVADRTSWLLFINAAETHAPYLADAALLSAQRRLSAVRNWKGELPDDIATRTLMNQLREAQRNAVTVVGRRLRRLIDRLPRPFDYLICADHGESFGERRRWGHVHAAPEVMEVPLWIGSVE